MFSGAGTSTLILIGAGTSTADWEAALALVRFSTASDNPDTYGTDTARTISVTVNDGSTAARGDRDDRDPSRSTTIPAGRPFNGDMVTFTEGDRLRPARPEFAGDGHRPGQPNFAGGSFSIGVQINPSPKTSSSS